MIFIVHNIICIERIFSIVIISNSFILSVTPLCTWQKGAIPYDEDTTERHSLKSAGRSKDQNIKELTQKGTGLNQVDKESNLLDTGLNLVNEEETLLSTEFKRRFKKYNGFYLFRNQTIAVVHVYPSSVSISENTDFNSSFKVHVILARLSF